MEPDILFLIVTGICVLLIIASGIIMRQMGRPYKGVVFTLHKLSVLAAIVFAWISIKKLTEDLEISGNSWLALLITIILGILSFVSGALQSFEKPAPPFIKILHKICSYLLIIATILTFILIT